MEKLNSKKLRMLRILLLLPALGWGVSFLGVLLPWSQVAELLSGLGLANVPDSPMFIYWFRMTAGAFGFIGVFFFLLAMNPLKHRFLIVPAGSFMIAEGVILLVHGVSLKLPPLPFYFDVAFGIISGTAIIILNSNTHPAGEQNEELPR